MSTKDFIFMVSKESHEEDSDELEAQLSAELADLKKKAIDNGGTITKDFPLFKGFAVSMPADAVSVSTFSSSKHVHVEEDGEVRTQ